MEQVFSIDASPCNVLTASLLDDTIRIGTRSRFVLALLGDLAGRPVVAVPAEGWAFRHMVADWAREAAEENGLNALHDALVETLAGTPMPELLFEQRGDAEFFPTLGNLPTLDRRRHFDSPATLEALRQQLAEDRGGWPPGKAARIKAILDAAATWDEDSNKTQAAAGLTDVNRRRTRQNILVAALRSRIAMTPASTLDGLLLKTLSLVNCRFEDDARGALDGTLDDLVKTMASKARQAP